MIWGYIDQEHRALRAVDAPFSRDGRRGCCKGEGCASVHERSGCYEDFDSGAHASMVLGAEIDLRMFPKHWVQGFALTDGPRPLGQGYDVADDAVHKVFLTDASDRAAFETLVRDPRLVFRHDFSGRP